MKISEFFLSENFQFLEVNFSIYLNRRVFLMNILALGYINYRNFVSSGAFDVSLQCFSTSRP